MTPLPVLDRPTITEQITDEPELCESDSCNEQEKLPPHPADYVALLPCPCSFSYLVCQHRVDLFAFQEYVVCGCNQPVDTSGIVLWPIKGGSL